MKILLLLHFYQPYNQQKDILNRIVHESYLPLTRGLLKDKRYKIIANVNGALTEQLIDNGYDEVVDNFRELYKNNQIEFTGSAKYHAFLPLIPEEEIIRQIQINDEINKKYLGADYKCEGFFSPELGINQKILDMLPKSGYTWTCAEDLSKSGGLPDWKSIYKDIQSGVNIFFRNKRVSSLILSAMCRDSNDLIKETQDIHDQKYWFCVMDAETFGHHRIGHEKILFDIMGNNFFEPYLVKDLLKAGLPEESVSIRSATWTNQEQDFWLDKEMTKPTEANSFILWKDPTNEIHTKQWELTDLAIDAVKKFNDKSSENYKIARELLDKAIASDQYWWASAKPWWSLEMVEQGAFTLKSVIFHLYPDSLNVEQTRKAQKLYEDIINKAFEWQRTGYIRQRHTDNSGTYLKEPFNKRAPAEWYNQVILEFEQEMKEATARQDFEKAIKWRDAVIKIGLGTDIYDFSHVVDELWSGRNIPWADTKVKPFLDHNWEEFSDFAKANFLNVKSKEDFENWKRSKN